MNKHFHFRKIYKAFFLAVIFSVVFFNNAFAAGKCPNNQIENKDGTKCICPSDAPYYNPYDKFCHYNDQGYEGEYASLIGNNGIEVAGKGSTLEKEKVANPSGIYGDKGMFGELISKLLEQVFTVVGWLMGIAAIIFD